MSKRSWDPFPIGEPAGGAIVLEKLNDERLQTELKYFVRWPCCDRTGVQTHSQLAKRARTDRSLCWFCARKLRALTDTLSRCKPPKGEDDQAAHCIEIPKPGISGRWMHLGRLGPRWGVRSIDSSSLRGGDT